MRGSFLLAFVALAVQGLAVVQADLNQDDVSVRNFLQDFDSSLKGRFIAAFIDLNGDGKPEAIVYLMSSQWCGSGGCTTLVLERGSNSWRIVSEVSITWPPIRVLRMKFNGWRSVAVWVQGGGIQPGYEGELRFDGKTYPTNPSMAPARPITGEAEGQVVIQPSSSRQRNGIRRE
jgi:hypothetical protein